MTQQTWILFAVLATLWLAGCGGESQRKDTFDGKTTLKIVCTTGMIADGVSRIAGDRAEIKALMGPGVDPHLYKATQGDLSALTEADIIFYTGLHLEGKMGEVLEKLARLKPVIAVADSLPSEQLLNSTNYAGAHDPHIWFDVSLWSEAMGYVGRELARRDPTHADQYQANTDAFRTELAELHDWVTREIATIPTGQRVMITAHDAFEYFGHAYNIEVRGLQGISTVSEYGLRDVSELVSFIVNRGIKAVFVESSVPRKSLEAVVEGCRQRDHEVRIGGTLFSDAMGEAGTPQGTYTGMVRTNVGTIVGALR